MFTQGTGQMDTALTRVTWRTMGTQSRVFTRLVEILQHILDTVVTPIINEVRPTTTYQAHEKMSAEV